MTGLWAADDLGPDQCATVRTEHDVRGFVTRTCFKTGHPGRVGVESESGLCTMSPIARTTFARSAQPVGGRCRRCPA